MRVVHLLADGPPSSENVLYYHENRMGTSSKQAGRTVGGGPARQGY